MPVARLSLEGNRTIVGYHGCDRATAARVVLGGEDLRPSENQWDWLGHGVYFWERSRRRAHRFALEQMGRGKVKEPFVLGAYIQLGNCLDLTDIEATEYLGEFFDRVFLPALAADGLPVPKNRQAKKDDLDILLRDLDCAVLNTFLAAYDNRYEEGEYFYQTVRGVFVEGDPIFTGSALRSKTHVQVAVRDPDCVLGYFVPRGYSLGQEVADEARRR